MEPSLSILLPVQNAQSALAANVDRVLEAAEEMTDRFEVLILDDGSTDRTIEVAQELAVRFPQVRALRFARPRGLAAVIRAGMEKTSGEILCLHEGQGEINVADMHQLWSRRADDDLVLIRSETAAQGEVLQPRRRRDAADGGYTGSGFHMLRRAALDALGRCEPLTAQPNELRFRRSDAAEVFDKPRRPRFLIRLRELAVGE